MPPTGHKQTLARRSRPLDIFKIT